MLVDFSSRIEGEIRSHGLETNPELLNIEGILPEVEISENTSK